MIHGFSEPSFKTRLMKQAPRLDHHAQTNPPAPRLALLLNPFYAKDENASFGKHVLTPTLALTSIAGATPDGWNLQYWDENLLQGPPPSNPFPQVVGISVHLTFAQRAYELAAWYRSRGAIVVLGGLHTLSCPEEVKPHGDAIAIGDGVQLWPRILRDIEAGQLQKVYEANYRTEYRGDPPPRREILPKWGFLTGASMIATRGCHNRCGFCYLATDGLDMPYRMRDPEQMVQEFVATGEPYAVFVDNNLGSNKAYLRRLCQALRPIKRIWSAAVTIDVTDDPSLIRDMALGGCTGVFIGFESLTAQNLDEARKKTPRPSDYARRVKILHDHGIQVNGSFVLGFDHDTPEAFEQLSDWIVENRLECATFHILTPYPGTPLFAQMEAEGRILHRDWSLYDTAHAVFQPKLMTPQELEEGYAWIYQRMFSLSSIWKRRPESIAAVPSYLAMSLLYKRSNWIWPLLIKSRMTHAAWRPLVELSRMRQVRWRKKLETREAIQSGGMVVYPGV